MSAAPTRQSLLAAVVAATSILVSSPAAADVVHLKNGQRLEGVAVEAGDEVAIRSAVGELRLPARLVDRIERGETLEDRAMRRLERLEANDVDGRLALAMELDQAGANTLSRRILDEVLVLDPDHPGARRGLGYVRCDGEWLHEEDCHAKRGEVLYQGRWVGVDERSMLETLALERRQSQLERLHARIQVDSARLEADRLASGLDGGAEQEEPFGYLFDPYLGGAAGAFYPAYGLYPYGPFDPFDPFDPIHGDRSGAFGHFGKGRHDRFDGGHGMDARFRFGDGRRHGPDGRGQGFVPGRHGFRGPHHLRGGQPPRPLVRQHNRSRLAPTTPGVLTAPPARPVAPPRPVPPAPGS
jgi:hypothetical protein